MVALGARSPARAVDDPTVWPAETPLTAAADAKNVDAFGWSVAISGNTAIVGARVNDGNMPRPGSAYVFVKNGADWTREARLIASDAATGDRFGHSVAISGDIAIVGALRNNFLGRAYIFVREDGEWKEEQILTADVPLTGDLCGFSVAISGDTAVVGCQNNSRGTAYVFVRNNQVWTQEAKLTAVDSAPGDQFARAVALSGDTLIVGAFSDKLGGAQPKGSATVFVRTGTTWAPEQKIVAADGQAFDVFGFAVAVGGNTALISSTNGDFLTQLRQSAYVFVRSGTTWLERAKLIPDDLMPGDNFGRSVALRGDIAIVGAFNDHLGTTTTGSGEGSAYRFQRSGSVWAQKQKFTAGAVDRPVAGCVVEFTHRAPMAAARVRRRSATWRRF